MTREEEHIEVSHRCFLCGEAAIHAVNLLAGGGCNCEGRISLCQHCFYTRPPTNKGYYQMLPIPLKDLGFD